MKTAFPFALRFSALALALCLGFSGCNNLLLRASAKSGDKTGTIKVGLGASAGKASKTILPGFAAEITRIAVDIALGTTSLSQDATLANGWNVNFVGLAAGTWTISATAYKGTTQIGTGTGSATVAAGATTGVTVPITYTGDAGATAGDLSIKLSWPVETKADYLGWTFNGVAMTAPAVAADAVNYTTALNDTGVAPGSYNLVLTFKRGGSAGPVVAVILEAVNIVKGLTSNYWINSEGDAVDTMSFALTDFFDSTTSLAGLIPSAGALSVAFTPKTYEYRSAAQIDGNISFTLTPGAEGQSISYTMDGTAGTLTANADGTKTTQTYTVATASRKLIITVLAPDRTTSATYTVILPLFVSTTAALTSIAGNLSYSYVLDADVDVGTWAPIAQNFGTTTGYSGTFDGNGHTITYAIDSTSYSLGVFGNILSGGTVKNLHVVCNIKSSLSGDAYIGAIAGQNMGTIVNCSSSGTINAPACNFVGGIVGQNGRYSTAGTISGCYSTVAVTGNSQIGGLVGLMGEILYTNKSTITDSYARGNVTGSNSDIGGLVGYLRSGTVTNCYAAGTVAGTSNVGGFAGRNNSGTITASYYDSTVFTGTTSYGTGLTTAQMKVSTNFSGWDFSSTWGINTAKPINGGYPYLTYFLTNTTVYD
jgi:hypothetical protein